MKEEPPPLGSWARLYTAVLAAAVLVMVLLYLLTLAFNVPLEER